MDFHFDWRDLLQQIGAMNLDSTSGLERSWLDIDRYLDTIVRSTRHQIRTNANSFVCGVVIVGYRKPTRMNNNNKQVISYNLNN